MVHMQATAQAMRQAEIARRLGVTRNYISQLRQEPGFPQPTTSSSNLWELDGVLRFLRQRAAARKPGASYCVTCGGPLT